MIFTVTTAQLDRKLLRLSAINWLLLNFSILSFKSLLSPLWEGTPSKATSMISFMISKAAMVTSPAWKPWGQQISQAVRQEQSRSCVPRFSHFQELQQAHSWNWQHLLHTMADKTLEWRGTLQWIPGNMIASLQRETPAWKPSPVHRRPWHTWVSVKL